MLQIAGSKHWRIHQPPFPLPHLSQPFDPRSYAPSGPLFELDLVPGDLLYLPRGFVHTTTTSGRSSVHVTLGITVYTWVELLTEWAQSSKQNRSFRRALPPGFAEVQALRQSIGDRLRQMIAELEINNGLRQIPGELLAPSPIPARWPASGLFCRCREHRAASTETRRLMRRCRAEADRNAAFRSLADAWADRLTPMVWAMVFAVAIIAGRLLARARTRRYAELRIRRMMRSARLCGVAWEGRKE